MRTLLRCALLSSAAAALLIGCGAYEPGEDALDVRVRQVFDVSEGTYVEGSYSFVRVVRPQGGKLVEERLPDGEPAGQSTFVSEVVLRLDPGEYRFISFQRPCDGSCDSLDPPTDECERVIRVARREARVTVTVRPGEGCTIEVE
jgi:hypothetical protein